MFTVSFERVLIEVSHHSSREEEEVEREKDTHPLVIKGELETGYYEATK